MFRILHLGKFYSPHKGGIESVTASLAIGAVRAGNLVKVLCFDEHASGCTVDNGVQIIRVLEIIRIFSQPISFAYFFKGYKFIHQVDIVHIHAPNMIAALLTFFIPKHINVVIHWHSDLVGKGMLSKVFAIIELAMLRRADSIICTSKNYLDASKMLCLFRNKVDIVPLGVSDPFLLKKRKKIFNYSLNKLLSKHIKNRPLVLSIGRLVPYKGFSVLIEAASLMRTDAAIVVVGTGILYKLHQKQIESLNVKDRVIFVGSVNEESLYYLHSIASVFCMSSIDRSEAFGVVLIEAMAWGLPIIATQISGSGVPWVNLHKCSGLNVPPNDPAALAKALDDILNDQNMRQNFARGARLRYEKFFVDQVSIDSVLKIYKKLYESRILKSNVDS